MNEATTRALDVPGAVLIYDVRSNESGTEPILLLFASPMGAQGFGTLARHFTDRTVVSYDPRGRSGASGLTGPRRRRPTSTPTTSID
jgi:hypothetical protein